MQETKKNIFAGIALLASFIITAAFITYTLFFLVDMPSFINLPIIFYFTVHVNMFGCIWFLYLSLKSFFKSLPPVPVSVSLSITVYLLIAGIVFWAFLVPGLIQEGHNISFDNIWLHTATPIIATLSFLFLKDKKRISIKKSLIILIYPALYLGFSFWASAKYNNAPYPFLDIEIMNGALNVVLSVFGITLLLFILSFILIVVYRKLSKKDPQF